MATYVNNTPREAAPADGSGTGVIVGVLLVVLLAILFLVFGLPYLRDRGAPATGGTTSNSSITLPGTDNSGASGGVSGGASGVVTQ